MYRIAIPISTRALFVKENPLKVACANVNILQFYCGVQFSTARSDHWSSVTTRMQEYVPLYTSREPFYLPNKFRITLPP